MTANASGLLGYVEEVGDAEAVGVKEVRATGVIARAFLPVCQQRHRHTPCNATILAQLLLKTLIKIAYV